MWFAEWIFWGSLVFIFYAYAGYLLVLVALSAFRSRPVVTGDIQPRVSFIITAYNEESRIKEKIDTQPEGPSRRCSMPLMKSATEV